MQAVTLLARRGQPAAEVAADLLARNEVPFNWVDLDDGRRPDASGRRPVRPDRGGARHHGRRGLAALRRARLLHDRA
jgi:hypothetical protein